MRRRHAGNTEDRIRTTSRIESNTRVSLMNFFTQVKPISYLKRHAEDLVKSLAESREPLLITQNGEARLVVMDVRSYEEHNATLALLKVLALGGQEIEQGEFRAATDVFAELDKEDTQQQRAI